MNNVEKEIFSAAFELNESISALDSRVLDSNPALANLLSNLSYNLGVITQDSQQRLHHNHPLYQIN